MHQGHHPGPQDYSQQSTFGNGFVKKKEGYVCTEYYLNRYGNGYVGGQKPAQQQNSGKPVKVVLCERFSQGHCDRWGMMDFYRVSIYFTCRGAVCQFAHGVQELHMYRARQV